MDTRAVRTVAVLCVAVVASSVASGQPAQVDAAVFRNISAANADDFHVTFTRGALQNSRAANAHANTILGQNGVVRGQFNTITTTNAQGGGAGVQRRIDFTMPRNAANTMNIVVPNKHMVSATLGFTTPGALAFTATFTLGGAPIPNSVQQVDPNKKFRPLVRGAGFGEVVFDLEAQPDVMGSLTNVRVWTGLSMGDLAAIDLLSEGDATPLDDLLLGAGESGTLSLGEQSFDSFAVVKFDYSFFDTDLQEWIDAGPLVYGAMVPAPGALALLAGAGLVAARRRR